MSDLAIVNSAVSSLIADSTFLGYFGLTTGSTAAQMAVKIQKEMEPNGLTSDNVPLCCVYPIPGLRSKINDMIYDAMFEVAVYSDSSSAALSATSKAGTMVIGARVLTLLHTVQLAGDTIPCEFVTGFQSPSNVSGIKKYVMRFKVGDDLG